MKHESQPHIEGTFQPEASSPPTELDVALNEIETVLNQSRGKGPEQQVKELRGILSKVKPRETT